MHLWSKMHFPTPNKRRQSQTILLGHGPGQPAIYSYEMFPGDWGSWRVLHQHLRSYHPKTGCLQVHLQQCKRSVWGWSHRRRLGSTKRHESLQCKIHHEICLRVSSFSEEDLLNIISKLITSDNAFCDKRRNFTDLPRRVTLLITECITGSLVVWLKQN